MVVTTDAFEGRDVVYEISKTISEQTNVDVCDLPPLYETIDPDALYSFLRCSDSTDAHPERSAEFSYCGYRVTVDSAGQIQLYSDPESKSSIPSA